MMNQNVHAVIMAGGSGKRFWPYSTPEIPKQFLDLTGGGTLLQLTLERVRGLVPASNIWVLTNERYTGLVAEQGPDLDPAQIVGEPLMRDTSAAVALGAGLIHTRNPKAVMVVLPADHVIHDKTGFAATMRKAVALAEKDHFVTIGIKPVYPAEGFGYLERGDALDTPGAYRLKRFVEKPRRPQAEEYLAGGRHYWNAGMFIWKTANVLDMFRRHLPAHAAMAEKLGSLPRDTGWMPAARAAFEPLEKISIDFGLMEKLDSITAVEAAFDWNDVGGWLAIEELSGRDGQGNTIQGHCIVKDSSGNIIIRGKDAGPVIVSGIHDSVIVASRAGTLVCGKDDVERIKELVEQVL